MDNAPNIFQFLTPERQKALADVVGRDERQRSLEEQLAQAEALRHPGPKHTSGIGGGLGAVADILNAYTSKRDSAKARSGMAHETGLLGPAYEAQAGALHDMYNPQQQPEGGEVSSATPMTEEPQPGGEAGAPPYYLQAQTQAQPGQPEAFDLQGLLARAAALKKPPGGVGPLLADEDESGGY